MVKRGGGYFKNFARKRLDKIGKVWYNDYTESGVIKMKKDKRQFKMTPEQLQGLLHMRKRNWVQKNGKAYNRKQKHKGKEQ